MLYFLFVWTILVCCCTPIGAAVLNWCNADCFDRQGDRFIVSVWLGILSLSVTLLAISLFLPLSPWVGAVIAPLLLFISLLSPSTRKELGQVYLRFPPGIILAGFSLAVIIAAFTSQKIVWFDTGLYHLGTIRWLSTFGAVPGVALINLKFGFTSSWFALSAPLSPALLGERIGAVTNGFIFLVANLQFLIAGSNLRTKTARFSDWFLTVTSGLVILIYTVTALTGSPILISFSSDVTITFLIIITAWTILKISESQDQFVSEQQNRFDARIIPLILTAGAVTVKLSALPLLPVGLLYYSLAPQLNFRKQAQRALAGAGVSFLILFPVFTVATVTSGCPLYPSQAICFDLPWTVTEEMADNEIKEIQFWWKFDPTESTETEPAVTEGFLPSFWNWLFHAKKPQMILVLTLISGVGAIWSLLKPSYKRIPAEFWLVGIGVLGSLFVLTQSPLLRYGLGYFTLVPCFMAAVSFQSIFARLKIQLRPQLLLLLPLFLTGLILAGSITEDIKSRLLLPAEIRSVKLVAGRINDVNYVYPDRRKIRCWLSNLPCTPLPLGRYEIQLREPSQGIKAGFVHSVD
ncbi:MAG: LIC_10190 family membrane protein [Microcoleaceae cyanobacterium]